MIVLRELARGDIPLVNAWRRDRRVVEGLAAPFRHIDEEVDERWFDQYLSNRGRDVRCAICSPEGPLLGVVSLTGIDRVHRNGEFHILIGDAAARGRGCGTAATQEMLRHAFTDLNLHRVWLTVLATNGPAQRVYAKTGFRREGVLRDSVFKDGRYLDQWVMSVLAPASSLPRPRSARR